MNPSQSADAPSVTIGDDNNDGGGDWDNAGDINAMHTLSGPHNAVRHGVEEMTAKQDDDSYIVVHGADVTPQVKSAERQLERDLSVKDSDEDRAFAVVAMRSESAPFEEDSDGNDGNDENDDGDGSPCDSDGRGSGGNDADFVSCGDESSYHSTMEDIE